MKKLLLGISFFALTIASASAQSAEINKEKAQSILLATILKVANTEKINLTCRDLEAGGVNTPILVYDKNDYQLNGVIHRAINSLIESLAKNPNDMNKTSLIESADGKTKSIEVISEATYGLLTFSKDEQLLSVNIYESRSISVGNAGSIFEPKIEIAAPNSSKVRTFTKCE